MEARIAAATAPYPDDIQAWLDRTMPPGKPPLRLFTTLARDPRLFGKFFSAGLLDRGHLTLRQREIVITRTTALCRSEYEWGVHIAIFGARVGFTPEQVIRWCMEGRPITAGRRRSALLRLCDALHHDCDVDDALWQQLREDFSEEALLELLMLAGFYRTVSYLTNALRLPLEPDGERFPAPYIDASSMAR
jgi:alkylhydroperoxidase family enzyme